MATVPVTWRPPHARPREVSERAYDARRGSSTDRGYTWKWRVESKQFLAAHPWCVMCQADVPMRYERALIVDHIKPHRGNQTLFWDRSNWQSLCKWHHDSVKQQQERAEG